ncbi:hypothetical protein [Sphingobium boeckii]|uniref:Uncharacterized protein n=1 Tax=Sphingobium boeckii TaxID=1082345 RepID=A0A7W9EDZ6_9SPHN|nr:hypothetical protein [Sphingobium boeckii]MBB5685652.1 hypothetical protein [Sphingobium boeckii]
MSNVIKLPVKLARAWIVQERADGTWYGRVAGRTPHPMTETASGAKHVVLWQLVNGGRRQGLPIIERSLASVERRRAAAIGGDA